MSNDNPPIMYPSYPDSASGPPTYDPLIPAGLSGWFGRSWEATRRSLRPLLLLSVASAVLGIVVELLLAPTQAALTAAWASPDVDALEVFKAHPVAHLAVVAMYAVLLLGSALLAAGSGQPSAGYCCSPWLCSPTTARSHSSPAS